MKLPLAPTPLPDLLTRHGEKLFDVLRQSFEPTVGDRYEHWDRLRHLDAPGAMNHEQWWLGIKLSRNSQYRQLPLRDIQGRPFVYMLPDRVQQALHRIDSQARGWIGSSEHVTNPNIRDRFIVSSLIEEATTSSQLEGASTTRVVAANMLRSGRRPERSERTDDPQQLPGDGRHPSPARRAAHHRRHPAAARGPLPRTPWTIRTPRGGFKPRTTNASKCGTTATSGFSTLRRRPASFRNGCGTWSGSPTGASMTARSCIPSSAPSCCTSGLRTDHPFQDGNGRAARALFYWSMLRHDYWMFEFTSISRFLAKAPARYRPCVPVHRDRRKRSHLLHRASDRGHPPRTLGSRDLHREEDRAGEGGRADAESLDRSQPIASSACSPTPPGTPTPSTRSAPTPPAIASPTPPLARTCSGWRSWGSSSSGVSGGRPSSSMYRRTSRRASGRSAQASESGPHRTRSDVGSGDGLGTRAGAFPRLRSTVRSGHTSFTQRLIFSAPLTVIRGRRRIRPACRAESKPPLT